jgi:nitronate monooxygenase
MNLWAGQAVGLKHELSAGVLTRLLATQALEKLIGR